MPLGQIDKAVALDLLQGELGAGGKSFGGVGILAGQDPDGLFFDQLIGQAGTGGFQRRQGQVDAAVLQQFLQGGRTAFGEFQEMCIRDRENSL